MRKIWILAFVATSAMFHACKVSNTQSNSKVAITEPAAVIETIGSQSVTTEDFKYVYKKNNANASDAYTDKSVRDYLGLYTNFRLKVMEGERMGLDTTQSFKKELDGYKKQLAQPYMKEKAVTDKLVTEAYTRMGEEVHAAHILLLLAEDAEPKDTLRVYNQISDIRKKALKGEDFNALAKQYSQDPSAQTNGGDLGFFTALQMVYPFENAAYNTPVGQVSAPVRTKFGYHILKVYERRPSQGQVKTAHIMVRFNQGGSAEDSVVAKAKIDEIASKLAKGESWDALCSQFSDDARTKANKGELDWFGTGQMIPSFEAVAFKLKNKGDISSPVQTPYGFHIIKLVDKRELEPFDKMEPTLKTKVTKDSRSEINHAALIKRLKVEDKLVENKKSLTWALSKADSNLVKGKWVYKTDDKELTNTLFSIADQNFTIGKFFEYVKSNQSPKPKHTASFLMSSMYNTYLESSLIAYEEAHLESKYYDYKMLMREYHDGILLFQLMEDNVWTKAIADTAGLVKYFGDHKSAYNWSERANGLIVNAANQQILDEVKAYLKQNLYPVNDLTTAPIEYEKNVSTLKDDAKKLIEEVAARLAKDKNLFVQFNLELAKKETIAVSSKRIDEVKKLLLAKGTDLKHVTFSSFNGNGSKALLTTRFFSDSKKALEKLINKSNALNVQITEGKFEKNSNEFLNQATWAPGESTVDLNGRKVWVNIKDIEAPRPKLLEETRGQVVSDYQNYLEKTWIESLKAKSPVVVNEAQLKTVITK